MRYNFSREAINLADVMEGTEVGKLAPVEEERWEDAKRLFIDRYPEDTLPLPDTVDDDPLVLPLEDIRNNLTQMCKNAEKTHRLRRYMLGNREIKRWAIWLDIGCRTGFVGIPEYPPAYYKAIKEKQDKAKDYERAY